MPGVRRGRRVPQSFLQMLSIFRMRSIGQLVPACRENPGSRKPIPGQARGLLGTLIHMKHNRRDEAIFESMDRATREFTLLKIRIQVPIIRSTFVNPAFILRHERTWD
jgi:hypothetical protein